MSIEIGFEYIDLLQKMREKGSVKNYFFTCDPHWNDYGNKVVSDILYDELSIYQTRK